MIYIYITYLFYTFFSVFGISVVSVGRRWHEWQEPWLLMLVQFLALMGRRTRLEQVQHRSQWNQVTFRQWNQTMPVFQYQLSIIITYSNKSESKK